jgi:uncharacterized protein
MKMIFYNRHENRLRMLWRVIIVTTILMAAIVLFSYISTTGYGFTIPLAVTMMLLLWFASKKVDKRPYSDYGFEFTGTWFRDFAAGNLMAALAMAAIVSISLGMDWMVIESFRISSISASFISGLSYILVVMIAVSIWEEAYFRSYLISNFTEGFQGRWMNKGGATLIAVLLSSMVFGLLHFGNPNASWVSTLNITIAGMVFAYPYIVTKSIAIPVGMHLSWNYFQGAVFGLPVSGNQFDQMLMVVDVTGPEVFTGGSFGPEAGAAGLLGLMILLTLNEVFITRFYKK